ncbi:MAG: transcription-repair coupling factor [Alphaproteobacteria bacterium]|nr:transcription-repair coupling factor [Alphaproteobacteria bacterium]
MAGKSEFSFLPASAHGLVLAELWEKGAKNLLYIAVNDAAMEQVANELAFFAPDACVFSFPAWDVMPYDRISPKTAIMAERMQTLSALAGAKGPYILLTTVAGVLQKLPPRSALQHTHLSVRRGQEISPQQLIEGLLRHGYTRVSKTMEPGEFSVRGSIMDVMPAESSEGFRLDWFGNQVESIKRFDPMTQLSTGPADDFTLNPTSEVLLTEESITAFREGYRELFGLPGKDDALYEAISQGAAHPGMEHFLPLFYRETATLFDYAPDAELMLDAEAITAAEERLETIADYYEARTMMQGKNKRIISSEGTYHPVPPERMFISGAEWNERYLINASLFSSLSSVIPASEPGYQATPSALTRGSRPPHAAGVTIDLGIRKLFPFIQGQVDNTPFDQLREMQERGKPVAIACVSAGSRDRLFSLLMERNIHTLQVEKWKEAARTKGKTIALFALPIEHGFETPGNIILSEQDVLGERITRSRKKKKTASAFFAEAASWGEGDLVVHKEHGIARFAGLVTLAVNGASHDCLKLVYDGDDKLFLPVENIELVTRFGMEEEGVKLDKLGGASWQSRKAKLKERITIAAEALLKTAALRQMKRASIIERTTGTYDEFTARFGFVETDDQARAIEETLDDLSSGKPMDRLICGDVGFGKTEVALRAAFVVTNAADDRCQMMDDGEKTSLTSNIHHPTSNQRHQVALICPTTLLARQHYKNFKARFAGFPVEVRQLSRMVPASAQKQTLADLKEGKVDIVIGTHALLAKGVEFKNLGLLIVDEEQHFGVAQKEKLKSLKSDVHVLTLSATPIPRTLQMALTGVRDLSLITTPPIDRLAIRSFVTPFDPVTVREAIMRELHRGGQCFVVTPRIKHIAELKTALAELVPDAKLCVAHGQMAAAELDKVMNDFYDGKYNVLLSTAIIESGLDIPTANTMVVHNAHLFGLSQLYQMRGRVGRAKTRAYAYFMLPHRRELTKNATRRLEIMQTLDSLGAGFTLANHDMDIRGFGNLVGEEQSGHIKEVGIELYQQMLEEAVALLRQNTGDRNQVTESSDALHLTPDTFTPVLNLGLSVLIPEYYVNDLSLRMGLYRRASTLANEEEISSFAAELVDRFGSMPEETRAFVETLSLKLLCKQAGIDRIDTGPKGAVISFYQNQFTNPEALLAFVTRRVSTLKIRPDQKIGFSHEWKNGAEKITVLKKLAGEIAALKTP